MNHHWSDKKIEQVVIPVICFLAIVTIQMKYLTVYVPPSFWAKPHSHVDLAKIHNLRTFFVGIRTRWVLENIHSGQIPVQTIRDFTTVTTAGAAAAMSFISIFVGLSKSGMSSHNDLIGCPANQPHCSSQEAHLRSIRFGLCIANFVVIFFNMLLATRYAINASFMLNTKFVDDQPLSPMLAVNVIVRASFHYSIGIRGFFLAAPLVSWLFGSWLLLGTTVFYVIGIYMMESDFLISDEIWEEEEAEHMLVHEEEGRGVKISDPPSTTKTNV